MGKPVEDIEMGRKAVWGDVNSGLDLGEGQHTINDRVSIKDGELGEVVSPEMRTHVDETGRFSAHPRRASWGRKSGSWEASPEVQALAAKLGESNRVVERGSISGGLRSNDTRQT